MFSKLDIEEVVTHKKEQSCTAGLTECEVFMLDEAFSLMSMLTFAEDILRLRKDLYTE